MAIVILSLVFAVLVTMGVCVAMFLSVAFPAQTVSTTGASRFSPNATANLRGGGTRQPSARGFSAAQRNLPTAWISPRADDRCPIEGRVREVIPVTAPEVFAIAEYVRATRSAAESARIALRARRNVDVMAAGQSADTETPLSSCPLLETDGTCAAFSVRPIWCQTCALCQAAKKQSSSESLDGVRRSAEQDPKRGLSAGLRLAELDGSQYELNDALATVLAIPDAAEQWGRGDDVFRNCSTC